MSKHTGTHTPRKRFGQHFLTNGHIIEQIIRAIHINTSDHIVEIGPGQGALTAQLLSACNTLDVIEIDRDLTPPLISRFGHDVRFHLHQADALKFDFNTLYQHNQRLRIVGNLPYNISTPLLFHLIESCSVVEDIHVMLQKEVVDRLAASPSSPDYGRLSVMMQYHCQIESLLDVSPSAFTPPPKVNSAVVRLTPYTVLPHRADDPLFFSQLVRTAFSQRRKTLRNNLKLFIAPEYLATLDIDLSLRPENLSVAQYVHISNKVGGAGLI
jgi:16S rRNA (adenine1518-N6/adenine1519-N6)-dimethyltransferase